MQIHHSSRPTITPSESWRNKSREDSSSSEGIASPLSAQPNMPEAAERVVQCLTLVNNGVSCNTSTNSIPL